MSRLSDSIFFHPVQDGSFTEVNTSNATTSDQSPSAEAFDSLWKFSELLLLRQCFARIAYNLPASETFGQSQISHGRMLQNVQKISQLRSLKCWPVYKFFDYTST
ncbi:uncharacterized protein LOC106078745 [Biomphalaria glabrata]|uniref:Uncharacterized protein LOC106078745 n=1 Tax=Biomphalaria glabrata TaxID=6526 RepID=A0A9W3AAG6_BIOGL|nr:uncharacterized protein LOC106078745 [Biomphalaria glabrata]